MAHGGRRQGAGRKAGSVTTRTREIADKAIAEGLTPLDYLLTVMRDDEAELQVRLDAAKGAAPYVHPKLAAITHTGKDGGAIQTEELTQYSTRDVAKALCAIFARAETENENAE